MKWYFVLFRNLTQYNSILSLPLFCKLKRTDLILTFFYLVKSSFAQNIDSTKFINHFSGAVTITNNGISLIPSFSLGKPAIIFDLSMGKGDLSFEPQFRVAFEGKPWAFIFWWRYKIVEREKFRFHIGAHPALMFLTTTFGENGKTEELLEARRFVAAEISPNIILSKRISFKPYYLFGHGFDRGLNNTHYVAMRGSISNIGITEHLYFGFTPQVYYLKMDESDGFYFATNFSLTHNQIPLSLEAMINKKIESEIASKDFIWNVSLIYSFGNN
jgi:hypothetical protein